MSVYSGRRVLVTGAGGFIGSHLVERLVHEGASVRAFLRYTSSPTLGSLAFAPADVVRDVEIVRGDLRDSSAVEEVVRDAEVVFHLGALIGIPYSYVRARETVETNVIGTLNVLMAARQAKRLRRVVHTSTSEVYGSARYEPMDERHPLCAQSPYAASKIGADKLVESFHLSYGLPVVTVRPFNTYGPRQSGRAVIPTMISQGLRVRSVKLGSLHPVRDFTFVTDTVEGFLRAGRVVGADGKTVHLGTGEAVSVGKLLKMIGKILGKDLVARGDASRRRRKGSEVERLVSTPSTARKVLGWKPAVSLEEGLSRTVEWIRAHADLYRPGRYEI